MNTKVLTAHVPLALAEKVDQLAARQDRSRGWVVKQALSAWVELEEERSRLTREALADVDAGRVIPHQAVQAWADSLSRAKRALCRDAPVPRRPWMAASGLLQARLHANALLPVGLLQPFK